MFSTKQDEALFASAITLLPGMNEMKNSRTWALYASVKTINLNLSIRYLTNLIFHNFCVSAALEINCEITEWQVFDKCS